MNVNERRPDLILFVACVSLVVLGLIVVFSASYSTGMQNYGDPYYFIKRQLLSAAIGLLIMMFLMRFDLKHLRSLALPGLVVSMLLLIVVLIVGDPVKGSRSWINLGFTTFQPSELTKLALVNFVAAFVAYKKEGMREFWGGLMPPLLVLGLFFGLIMLQPDFGTSIALAGAIVIMLFASGVNLAYLAMIALSGVPVLVYLVVTAGYRMRRITSFLNPWADPLDSGWNIIQSLLAIGSGGLFGLGLGLGRQKFAYLPEQHTDFIFSVAGEEFGLLGTSLIVFLFFVLVWRGCRVGMQAPDLYSAMLAVGLTAMIGFQAILNIGVATGSLPVTGVTLPLISYGGTSLIASFAAVGILLNISKSTGG